MRPPDRSAHRCLAGAALVICLSQVPANAQKNLAGAVQTKLALDRLPVLGSVLLISAHPDDENAALLKVKQARFVLTCDPDVALLGLSTPEEQEATEE